MPVTSGRFGRTLRVIGVVVGLAVCGLGSRADAQAGSTSATAPSQTEEQARSHFNTGSLAFGAGRYDDALVEFQKAYALSQRPKLLYNIGVASDRLRHDRDALAAFEQYLQLVPDAPERAEVESRIIVLRGVVTAPEPTPRTVPNAPSEAAVVEVDAAAAEESIVVEEAPAAHPSVGQWLVLGASGVFAVTGGVLLTVALKDKAAVESPSNDVHLNDIEGAHDRVPLFSTLGGVMLGVGLAGAAAATTWILLSGDDHEVEAQVGLGHLGLRGSF